MPANRSQIARRFTSVPDFDKVEGAPNAALAQTFGGLFTQPQNHQFTGGGGGFIKPKKKTSVGSRSPKRTFKSSPPLNKKRCSKGHVSHGNRKVLQRTRQRKGYAGPAACVAGRNNGVIEGRGSKNRERPLVDWSYELEKKKPAWPHGSTGGGEKDALGRSRDEKVGHVTVNLGKENPKRKKKTILRHSRSRSQTGKKGEKNCQTVRETGGLGPQLSVEKKSGGGRTLPDRRTARRESPTAAPDEGGRAG